MQYKVFSDRIRYTQTKKNTKNMPVGTKPTGGGFYVGSVAGCAVAPSLGSKGVTPLRSSFNVVKVRISSSGRSSASLGI